MRPQGQVPALPAGTAWLTGARVDVAGISGAGVGPGGEGVELGPLGGIVAAVDVVVFLVGPHNDLQGVGMGGLGGSGGAQGYAGHPGGVYGMQAVVEGRGMLRQHWWIVQG